MANYLYNGVKLPGWGEAPHPYVVLYEVEFDSIVGKAHSYEVVFSETPFLWVSGDHLVTGITDSVCGYSMNLLKGETEWGELIVKEVEDYYETGYLGTNPIWANHDVYIGEKEIGGPYYATDELYLAASEPVPVTESDLDPKSMLLGWIMGRKAAALRRNVRTIWRGKIQLTEEHAAAMAYGTYATELPGTAIIEPGKTYALTVNGTVTVLTAEEFVFGAYTHGYLGNKWLYLGIWDPGGDESPGMDHCFSSCVKDGALVKNEFGARFPGTYNIRIEEVT